jgi:hypothetical protein
MIDSGSPSAPIGAARNTGAEAVASSIVGYIVLPSSDTAEPAFVPTLDAAEQRRAAWDWLIARVWSDGAVTPGDRREAGHCPMGLGGDYAVSRAADWLAQQPATWLLARGITASAPRERGEARRTGAS